MTGVAFLFPGQGSQYVGMGQKLHREFLAAKEVFEEASDALGIDMWRLCCKAGTEALTLTANTQPALVTVGVAAFRVYTQETGTVPAFLAGHSLGEITALTCAGVFPLAAAVRLARLRGQVMQEAVPPGEGAMAAVGSVDVRTVEQACANLTAEGQYVALSNINSPRQIVVSGGRMGVEALCDRVRSLGGRAALLKVSAPFHCALMQPAAERFAETLAAQPCGEPAWPVLSNVTARPHAGSSTVRSLLVEQIVKPVRWVESMQFLREQGISRVVDLGPGEVVAKFMRAIAPDVEAEAFDQAEKEAAAAQ